jgi:hypothetical protein
MFTGVIGRDGEPKMMSILFAALRNAAKQG